jgi:hypothetical protein
MKKMISRLLLVSFLLLAMVSEPGALAGGCGPTGCNISAVASKAPATASAHAFTASGGSRVADINLSQEARDGINADGKEAPLPKGCVTAADRAKLIAKQPPLYGWPQDEIPRSSTRAQLSYSIATHASRNSPGKVQRSLAGPVKPVTAVKVAIAAKAKSQN